jgi:hypothetical protein
LTSCTTLINCFSTMTGKLMPAMIQGTVESYSVRSQYRLDPENYYCLGEMLVAKERMTNQKA